jgi:hypothetical protein
MPAGLFIKHVGISAITTRLGTRGAGMAAERFAELARMAEQPGGGDGVSAHALTVLKCQRESETAVAIAPTAANLVKESGPLGALRYSHASGTHVGQERAGECFLHRARFVKR